MNREDFTGFVLAGGKSSRMGADKAFLTLGGETFLERAFNALAANVNEVFIVLNADQESFLPYLPANAAPVFDVIEERGAPGGIYTSLRNCPTKFAVLLAVDLPLAGAATIEKLCRIAENDSAAAIVPRQKNGKFQPLCAVWQPARCVAKFERFFRENPSASVRDLSETIEVKIVEADLFPDEAFFNVNTPEDLRAAEKLI